LIHKANLLLNEKGLQEPQKAIEYLNKAIKLQPDNDDAYNIRGNIHFILGKNQLAVDDFTRPSRSIQLVPTTLTTGVVFTINLGNTNWPLRILMTPSSLIPTMPLTITTEAVSI